MTGEKTTLGAWLDPMADKLLLVTMFVVLSLPGIGSANQLPVWFTILVISRDIAIVATVAVVNLAIGHRTFRPSIFGKIATATYILTGVVTLYYNYLGQKTGVVSVFIYGIAGDHAGVRVPLPAAGAADGAGDRTRDKAEGRRQRSCSPLCLLPSRLRSAS